MTNREKVIQRLNHLERYGAFSEDWKQALRDAIALLREQEPVGGWISVQDRLPEKAGQYLTFRNPSCIRVTGFSLNLESVDQYVFPGMKRPGWYDYDSEYGYYEWRDITYWMPLPEPPEEVSGDG